MTPSRKGCPFFLFLSHCLYFLLVLPPIFNVLHAKIRELFSLAISIPFPFCHWSKSNRAILFPITNTKYPAVFTMSGQRKWEQGIVQLFPIKKEIFSFSRIGNIGAYHFQRKGCGYGKNRQLARRHCRKKRAASL